MAPIIRIDKLNFFQGSGGVEVKGWFAVESQKPDEGGEGLFVWQRCKKMSQYSAISDNDPSYLRRLVTQSPSRGSGGLNLVECDETTTVPPQHLLKIPR